MPQRLSLADRPFAIAPRRTASRIYRVVHSSVRRLLNIKADTPASTPPRTPVDTERSTTSETVTSMGSVGRSLPGDHTRLDDAQVREWKGTWVKGADGRWAGT